ncbi:hypothetical protein HanXRQr2_Chr05g0199361 [Helianthus annuus]|uniref:Uncharacterized protein n=1 Tax=Helianthus annuus TaxID=4232 RepID=A0A251UNC2_HELAN|nr:hypothetical protein HanXRQr2_Chr05g0199361 [Helianthus annuus]
MTLYMNKHQSVHLREQENATYAHEFQASFLVFNFDFSHLTLGIHEYEFYKPTTTQVPVLLMIIHMKRFVL